MSIKSFKSSSIYNGSKKSNMWDSSTYSFLYSSNLMSWFDASDPNSFTLSGNSIVTWKDKGPVQADLWQSSSDNRPTLSQNTLNGRSVVTFDGTNDYILNRSSTVAYDRPFATFALIRPTAVTTSLSCVIFSGSGNGPAGSSDAHFYFIEAGDHSYWTGEKSIHATTTKPSQNTWHLVYTGMNASGVVTMRVNQVNQALTFSSLAYDNLDAAPTATTTRRYNNPIMGRHPAPNNSSFFPGNIAEILIYNKAMTSQEILDVENYLKTKWGV